MNKSDTQVSTEHMTDNTAIFYIRYTQNNMITNISFWKDAGEAEIVAHSIDSAVLKLTKMLGEADYGNKWVFKVDKISMIGLKDKE